MKALWFRPLRWVFALIVAGSVARAQLGTDGLKVGVLTDLSGPYAASSGPGSVLAAQMAVEDFGGTVRGKSIEVLSADHQNKVDIAATIAQRWFDLDKVDAIVDLSVAGIAVAVQALARDKGRTALITSAATSDLTAKSCTLASTQWADDTHALATAGARAVLERAGKSWFFLTLDDSFGHELQSEATQVIEAGGGKVLGSAKFPIGLTDFSPLLLQAASSGAEVIGLASLGDDLVNSIRQAHELGFAAKQSVAGFLVYVTDVHALGLEAAHDLTFGSGSYWDQNEASRNFANRFLAAAGTMPTKNHAALYTAVRHYLSAVGHARTADASTVNKVMRQLPVDYFGRPATVRADGRVIYDLTLYRVKQATESRYSWDYYAPVKTIPREDAFLPMNAACGP